MKKNIFLLVFILSYVFVFSQKITVKESTEKIGDGRNNCFTVTIYQVSERNVAREFNKYLRSNDAKTSGRRNRVEGEGTILKPISDRPINIYAEVSESKKDNSVELAVAFDLGGAYLSSNLHPKEAEEAKKILRNFSVELTQDAYKDLIDEEEKILKRQERSFDRTVKKKEDLEKDNENYKRRIERNIEEIKDLEKAIKDEEKAIKEQKEKYKNLKREVSKIR